MSGQIAVHVCTAGNVLSIYNSHTVGISAAVVIACAGRQAELTEGEKCPAQYMLRVTRFQGARLRERRAGCPVAAASPARSAPGGVSGNRAATAAAVAVLAAPGRLPPPSA